jgi:pimeloyl-ACP methyl ester carboxylesterase
VSAGGQLHYQREGEGEPLVLLHGIGGELCVWEPVVGVLAGRRDVIAVDLPGFGRSPALPEGVVPTPQALAGAVGGLMDELGIERAHVAGNSLGGWIALELARSGRAVSVVGLCPAGLWGAPLLPAGAAAGATRGRAHRVVRRLRPILPAVLLSRRARRLALGAFVANPDRVPYHAAWRMVRSYGRGTAYEATSTAMRQGHFSAPEEIRVPVTLAFGEFDRLIRPVRVEGFRSVMMPGCGHVPMWDDPQLVSELCLAGTDDATGRDLRGTPSVSVSSR